MPARVSSAHSEEELQSRGWQPTTESAEEAPTTCSEEQRIYITPKHFCPYPEDRCRFLADAFEV